MAMLTPSPKMQFFDANGNPLVGGKLYTYAAGTNTPLATYTDAGGATPNANPVILDSRGEANVWLGVTQYKFTLKDSLDNLIWTVDNLNQVDAVTLARLAQSDGSSLIGFLQSGTGAVATTVQAKLRETVSVKDFGAVGNGVTNDASAIQSALNTGKNVEIEKGLTFRIDSGLSFTSANQVLILNGTLLAGVAMNAVITSTDLSGVGITGHGEIKCNSLADNGVKFVATAANPTGVFCEGITVSNAKGPANATKGGIYFLSSGGKASSFRHKDVYVKNVITKNCGDLGVLIAYCDGVSVQGCLFDTCSFHGHESVNCTDVNISGNIAQDCAVSGIGVGDETVNWIIANNVIRNCAGDGSITCEVNSVFGVISNNTIIDANTQGINISYGAAAATYLKVQDVVCTNNMIKCKSGVTNKIGINYYSSTGAGVGVGVVISNNVIDGFNVGIAYQYSNNGAILGNTISNLVGASSRVVLVQMCTGINVQSNSCNTDTGDHAIKVASYAGTDCNHCNINNNYILAAGTATKALIYIEGTGSHNVSGNRTGGALNFVLAAAASTINVAENYGNLASSFYAGPATYQSSIGTATATTVGAAGAASALPANPLGYVTAFVVGAGNVKIPYYNV